MVTAAKKGAAKKKGSAKAVEKKKSAKKDFTKKETETRDKRLEVSRGADGRVDLDSLLAIANAKLGAGAVVRADQANCSYLLRRGTGIASLDIGLGGGFPASAVSLITGPDGVGKDFLVGLTAAHTQRVYGDDFCMVGYHTEFLLDKLFMKNACGLQIAFSDQEIEEINIARTLLGYPSLTDEEDAYYRHQVGKIYLIAGVTAEDGFDTLLDFVLSNRCQIAYVNSIGFLQTQAKEDTDSFTEWAQQRNEAALMSKVMPKLAMLLNRQGEGRNETATLFVNQVRSKDKGRTMPGRVTQEKDEYKSALASWALKHGKAIELILHRGPQIWDEVSKTFLGKEIHWITAKGKLGTHEGIRGEYSHYHDMGVDIVEDLVRTAVSCGVIQTNGAWYYFTENEDLKAQGKDSMVKLIRDDESADELIAYIREKCLLSAGIVCRYR